MYSGSSLSSWWNHTLSKTWYAWCPEHSGFDKYLSRSTALPSRDGISSGQRYWSNSLQQSPVSMVCQLQIEMCHLWNVASHPALFPCLLVKYITWWTCCCPLHNNDWMLWLQAHHHHWNFQDLKFSSTSSSSCSFHSSLIHWHHQQWYHHCHYPNQAKQDQNHLQVPIIPPYW